MIMSRDVHDAVDDARNGNMSSYNALPLKKCTPTSGHQIWQPNVKDGEAVCLAHQSRCKVNWNAESFKADRFNGLTTNFGTPKYDVHDAIDDARTGDMTTYNELPIKDCTPTSGCQIWQPNVKKGEAVCLAHQSRCKITWNAESLGDYEGDLSMTLANMERELGIDSEDYEDYGKYTNPIARLSAAISKIEREFDVNEEDFQYRGLKKDAESLTKNAVGMIVRDGDPSSPPSDIFMAEHGKNSYFNKEHDCYQCGKCHTAFEEESDANYCCTACYACGYADHVGFERAQKCCPCTCAETGGGPNGTCQPFTYKSKSVEDLIIQIDNGEDVFLHHLTKNQIDALSDHYSGSEIRRCFTCSVLTDDWDLISEGYECGTCSEGNRTDYEKRKYDGHLGPFGSEEEEMNAEYKSIKSQPFKHLVIGIAFTVSTLYFWSTAGSYVKNWVVGRVEKYAPGLLTPVSQVILTTAALFGIIGFGSKLYGSTKGLTIPSMIDLPLEA